MQLMERQVLLTGASGGIGAALAGALASRGARLVLSGRDQAALQATAERVRRAGGHAVVLPADLLAEDGPERLVEATLAQAARIDLLVNCAGATHFGTVEQASSAELEKLWRINVLAPMRLAQAVLPVMRVQGQGLIVNVGSVFGSIAFPCFAAYSTTKFALRGFSEALRRELAGSGIRVLYAAPRYTRTDMNAGPAAAMAEALKMNQDEPEAVALQILAAIEADAAERCFGWPERAFVRLNSLFPRLMDRALAGQMRRMRPYVLQRRP